MPATATFTSATRMPSNRSAEPITLARSASTAWCTGWPNSASIATLMVASDSARVTDTARLDLLLAHEATVVITPDHARWRQLATAYDIVGRLDAASAVEAALAADCWVLTAQPGLDSGFAGGCPIIPFPA